MNFSDKLCWTSEKTAPIRLRMRRRGIRRIKAAFVTAAQRFRVNCRGSWKDVSLPNLSSVVGRTEFRSLIGGASSDLCTRLAAAVSD